MKEIDELGLKGEDSPQCCPQPHLFRPSSLLCLSFVAPAAGKDRKKAEAERLVLKPPLKVGAFSPWNTQYSGPVTVSQSALQLSPQQSSRG